MTLILVPSCSLVGLQKSDSVVESTVCTSGFEVIKLNYSKQPRDSLENISHINCTLHNVCGFEFPGDEFCPET